MTSRGFSAIFIIIGVVFIFVLLFVLQDIFLAPKDKQSILPGLERLLSSVSDFDENNLPKFVKADFIDLDRIERISKFRSGQGHDFSQGTKESCRSMKHYYGPPNPNSQDLDPKTYTPEEPFINIYSPVNGTVQSIEKEHFPIGVQIYLKPNDYPQFIVRLFHIHPKDGLKSGDKVTAGEKLGYIGATLGTDVAINVRSIGGQKFFSYFQVISDEVFQKYKQRGANTINDFIITKEYRDANPLECNGESFAENYSDNLSDFVQLNAL